MSNDQQRQDNALTPEAIRALIRNQADKENVRSRSGDDVKEKIRSAEIQEEKRGEKQRRQRGR